ncbi:SDR family NAD(P)-dependent oxidoreductase [Rhizobium sp. P38BS-XIX]|uniref:SDR family NAD(P)-dependent oxidoreductase n=1 Tax=Rhizobium sp. P38BS-XIX TaxID=2726740 RepID=UPI001456668D|nr:SDR family NAD(P)-dependent oxidoreductase [Rhizobium sp. P38BS-XIX]NLR97369.1 SDR family NAD(P)-dependent oxidoreductase [Rhizobium sp. P38BS-XIX]
MPRLLSHDRPSLIANVSSGGAFVPQAFAPTYSACKAAIPSYTMVLREALAKTSCLVVEIIPPAVQTHLGGAEPHGAPLDAFCDTIFIGLGAGRQRIGFGVTEVETFVAAEKPYQDLFRQSADRANVPGYK